MELDGLARCLAHLRTDKGSPNDLTWKKIERLIHLCPNCQFKSINKIAAIRQIRAALEKQKERKPQFDRLYPPQDQLLDIKPETIYHFDELEQQSVLALCKYLCVSHGQYLHKILPLLLRYLATLHLAKWPPHYFKNLFLMKFQHNQNLSTAAEQLPNTNELDALNNNNAMNDAHTMDHNNDTKEEQTEEKGGGGMDHMAVKPETDGNLNAIEEEPATLGNARKSMLIDDDEDDDDEIVVPNKAALHPATSITTEKSATPITDRLMRLSDGDEPLAEDAIVRSPSDEIEIKYDEDIPSDPPHEIKEQKTNKPKQTQNSNLNDADNDLMKYMDNPLRSPLCSFVMEFVYNIGDISHAVEESAPIIRQAIIIILKEYIKILKEDDDGLQTTIGDEYELDKTYKSRISGMSHHHHSFYVVLPIIWGILNAIKEDVYVSINIDRKCALAISKCVDNLSKYNKNNTLWKSEWDILSTGVRASLLAYFLPPHGAIKAPKKVFETRTIKEYFSLSMSIIGVKKSPSSIEVREQHMRLATICAIYESKLRGKLEKTITNILHFHINKYIKSSFNVYKISPTKQNKSKSKKGGKTHTSKQKKKGGMAPRTLKYRMRDQTILINACCLVLEQLAERAPDQSQEISLYLKNLLIDRNAIYLQDEEINERLMDALACVCQCELKYLEQHHLNTMDNKRIALVSPHDREAPAATDDAYEMEEEKQLLDNEMEEKHHPLVPHATHHRKASSLIAYNEQHNKHWYDDSSTRHVFNELENNFTELENNNEESKLINRALRIYGAMMVKANHKLITQQFITSTLKGRLTQKLTVILPYLIDTAINQQATEIQFVKEIVQLLVQSYLTKSSSYQLDTKRKIAEAFTQLSSNLNQYNLRQFILCELLKMFTALIKTILDNHVKKKAALPLASNELGLILPAIAVLCTPLYPLEPMSHGHDQDIGVMEEEPQDAIAEEDTVEDDAVETTTKHKKIFKINMKKRDKKQRRHQQQQQHKEVRETERDGGGGEDTEDVHNASNNINDHSSNPSYFGTNEYIVELWGVTLMDNHNQTVAMFREFWNQIIFFDFVASTNNEYKIYLQTIASVSPVLVTGSSTLFGGGLIHESLKNKTNSLSISKQIAAMRSKLAHIIKLDVNHLEPDALLFLNVVYHVESFRVYSGTAYALAHYLNDAGIIRRDLQNYIEAIVDYVFDRYLEHIYQSKASSEKLICLESHTEYLVAMCCSRSSRIRNKCYSWLQHKLIAAYSYLQWRPKCLQNILDIVSKLETLVDDVSTELYSSNDAHSVITFNDRFSLDLPEDRKSRAEIRGIILDIAGAWLHSAWNLAPSEMVSVVAHKLSLYKSPLLSSLMYTQCKFNAHRDHDNAAQPHMGLMYVVSKCERYLGVMEGLYRTHLLLNIQKPFGSSKANLFIQTFKRYIAMQAKSCSEPLEQGMIEEMYQVAALIVWTYNKNISIASSSRQAHHFKLPLQELLHLLCMVPAIVFTANLVLCGTFVWRWIMTTSPELQEALIRQMRPSWSFVIEQRKGIFANKHVNNAKEIDAHDIWISWLLDSMENIIESSPESLENISVIMIDGLAAIPYDIEDSNHKQPNPKAVVKSTPNSNKPKIKLPAQKPPKVPKGKQKERRSSRRSNATKMNARLNDKTDKKQQNDPVKDDDTYIVTFGATLRFYTAVARILNALRLASVPLLSKTIATLLRGRLYRGVLQLFECKLVWRYPSSWKDVSSNAKAIVELFQFFITEHRHVIKRHSTTNNSNITKPNVPKPPSINIDNHRSKSKALHRMNPSTNGGNTVTNNNNNNNNNNNRTTYTTTINDRPPRPSLTTTMPYLSTTSVNAGDLSSPNMTGLHRHSHNHRQQRHRKAKSLYFNQGWNMRSSGSLRPRQFNTKSQTHRSPSIRRNSFGHTKNTSFELDIALLESGGGGHESREHLHSPYNHSVRSLQSELIFHQTDTMNTETLNGAHAHHHHVAIPSTTLSNPNNIASSYLFKLDSDDVYYWEGNNAFIQDQMTHWLHTNRGWCQMVCCIFLADELERLCAWYNTRDTDNVQKQRDATNLSPIPDMSGIDTDVHSNADSSTKKAIDDRISAFLYQEVLIEYINKMEEDQWSIMVDTSWSFNPLLAVRFYQRFKYKDFVIKVAISNNNNSGKLPMKTITDTVTEHIHQQPRSIQNIPDAVHLLITDSTVKKDGIELEELCQFTCTPLYKCLGLLKEKNLTHSIVNQYLFRSLRNESQINMEGVIFLIPQLLQALRFDPSGILREFLLDCAVNDLTMAHQLIWLCDFESYQGEDMHSLQNKSISNDNNNEQVTMHAHMGEGDEEEEDFCKAMERLSSDIRDSFGGDKKICAFYKHEFTFFDLINCASVDIDPAKFSKAQKQQLISSKLIKIRDSIKKYKASGNKLYMPTNPTWEIVDVLPDSVVALQSAAKVPFLVDFEVRKYSDDIGHMLQNNLYPSSPAAVPKIAKQKCIFKTHDDCGQDALALQIIEYFREMFNEAGLPLLLFPYRVIATRSGKDKVVGGMIECVRNARSRADLGEENGYRLRRHFIETHGDPESKSFRKAQRNFILSLAGYAVVCDLLQIKDRHNANIMINTSGHLIHIDFGFLFDISPGKNIGFETAGFKINDEMVELIGDDGSHTTPLFLWFVELCIRGYLVCREHMDEIISIIELSSNSNLPCFLPQTMTNLRNRFVPEKSPTQAAQHMKERVIHACSTWTTNAYDEFQKRSQGIWKAPAKDED